MKNIRSFAIVDYVKEKRYASLDELMRLFGVSSATIHRDVAELVQRDVFQRVRGGVAFVDNSSAPLKRGVAANSFRERADHNKAAKEAIARQALAFVAEGDILFLDSSTTVAAFADALSKTSFTNLTIVTNSVAAMRFFPKFPPHRRRHPPRARTPLPHQGVRLLLRREREDRHHQPRGPGRSDHARPRPHRPPLPAG